MTKCRLCGTVQPERSTLVGPITRCDHCDYACPIGSTGGCEHCKSVDRRTESEQP